MQCLGTPVLKLRANNDKEVCVWCQNFVGLNLTSFLPPNPRQKIFAHRHWFSNETARGFGITPNHRDGNGSEAVPGRRTNPFASRHKTASLSLPLALPLAESPFLWRRMNKCYSLVPDKNPTIQMIWKSHILPHPSIFHLVIPSVFELRISARAHLISLL
jgi:hypothetical protein